MDMGNNKHLEGEFRNQEGYVLIGTLMILMLLTIIGVSMTSSTSVELMVAGSEKTHQETFYLADGATEIASELLEQNFSCAGGFTANDGSELVIPYDPQFPDFPDQRLRITDLTLWMNEPTGNPEDALPSNTNRDLFFPDVADNIPHTNVKVQGERTNTYGGSLNMHSGYEPLGVSSAKSGVQYKYNIYAQHLGRHNSETTIHIQWRHVGGSVGACLY